MRDGCVGMHGRTHGSVCSIARVVVKVNTPSACPSIRLPVCDVVCSRRRPNLPVSAHTFAYASACACAPVCTYRPCQVGSELALRWMGSASLSSAFVSYYLLFVVYHSLVFIRYYYRFISSLFVVSLYRFTFKSPFLVICRIFCAPSCRRRGHRAHPRRFPVRLLLHDQEEERLALLAVQCTS